ncbi:Peptidase M23 [Desulfatibacillum aliphaticivorans]|uniref:Peptidase M23 n=1 Tax=Desulfatibacillum aliphaticivorans TaxID=218208 RepID=B8FI89_DESAL|nr:M23 family metallopeptidase [Desulfatibacillum aliphaticivorans]ACL02656.1 Peptidase M23 [Desulfatibacillum aliphaticivorans]
MAAKSSKYTVCLLPQDGSAPKQFTLSKWMVWVFVVLITGVIGAGVYLGVDNYKLRLSQDNSLELKNTITAQDREIERLRVQFAQSAERINKFNETLLSLHEFEKKIRLLANLEDAEDSSSFLAIGGSFPDELDPSLLEDAEPSNVIREMNAQVKDLNSISAATENSLGALIGYLEDKKDVLACTPSIMPLKVKKDQHWYFSSRFGYRTSPFTGLKEFHKGLDLCASTGTPIMSTANGKVTFCGKKSGFGNVIVIDHGHGISTRYAHLSKFKIKKGDKVQRGEIVGEVGNTGRSTGPHLHYEVHLNGVPMNPQRYILN